MHMSLQALAVRWQRFVCRTREARRLRRELLQLEQMSPHELRDIGFAQRRSAVAAAGAPSACL